MDLVRRTFFDTPPMTRLFCTACVLLTLSVHMELFTVFDVYFNPRLVFYRGQIWRLFTCFFYLGKMDMNFLFNVIFAYRHSYLLESSGYIGHLPELVLMWFFGCVIILILASFTGALVLNQALTVYLIYVWSRRNPFVNIDFIGFVTFPAPYFPLILLAISFLVNEEGLSELIGFWAGHMYYYHLEYVFPNTHCGFRLLRPPKFLKTWLSPANADIAEVHDETAEANAIRTRRRPPPPILENGNDANNNIMQDNPGNQNGHNVAVQVPE